LQDPAAAGKLALEEGVAADMLEGEVLEFVLVARYVSVERNLIAC